MHRPPALEDALLIDSTSRIPALDGLRGLAMMVVVGCHLVWPRPVRLDVIDRFLVRGWIGVDLFFVLSGFLITGILIDTRGRAGYFREFYVRRALRIFPIYFLLLGIYFIALPLVVRTFTQGPSGENANLQVHAAWYWLYLTNVLQVIEPGRSWLGTGHLWSLSVEEQFYFVWPFVVLVTPHRRLPTVCVATVAIAFGLRLWLVLAVQAPVAAYVLTPSRMDALAIGALVAALARSGAASAWLRRWHRHVTGTALAVLLPLMWWSGDHLTSTPMGTAGYTVTAIVSAGLIIEVLVRRDAGIGTGWLARGSLRRVGALSYGAYLFHLPLITLCAPIRDRLMRWGDPGTMPALAGHLVWVALMFALTLLAAAVSYRLIEQPFLALKNQNVRTRMAMATEATAST